MKKLFLLCILTIGMSLSAAVKFDFERELIGMYDNADSYPQHEVHRMCSITLAWLQRTIDDHVTKRKRLSHKDQEYLGRISCLLAKVCNESGYCF